MSDTSQPNPGTPSLDIKSISDSIFKPISELYKSGGLILVWIFIGTFLLIVALVAALISSEHILAYLAGGVGAVIILVNFVVFLIIHQRADNEVKKSKEFVDTVTEMAIEMTIFSERLQALAFKYEREIEWLISEALDSGVPLPSAIQAMDPRFPRRTGIDLKTLRREFSSSYKQLVREYVANNRAVIEEIEKEKEEMSKAGFKPTSIAGFADYARNIIEEVKSALISGDPRPLKGLLGHVKRLNTEVINLLKDKTGQNTRWDSDLYNDWYGRGF